MNLGTHTQQPDEMLDYDIDYSKWLTGTDRIASVVATVEPAFDATTNPDGLQATYLSHDGTAVKLWAKGGISGTTYKITLTAETDDGRIKQDEIKFKVKEL
jgi:hypothetical protein